MRANRETERGVRNEERHGVFAGRVFGLLAALVLTCAAAAGIPAAAVAEGSSSGCAGKAVSETGGDEHGRGSLKGFANPRTGEILTYEEALEMDLTGKSRTAHPGGARATAEAGRKIRLGRRVPLEGGGYIAEIESPLPYVKLKARISPGEATGSRCRGRAETKPSPKGCDRE